jgi:hypothetical protein
MEVQNQHGNASQQSIAVKNLQQGIGKQEKD